MTRWKPDARGRLARAAMELYGEHGFEQTTVAEIAERAGLTERTFFRHFADKREVLFDGAAALENHLVEGIAAAPPGASPMQAVAAGLRDVGLIFDDDHRPFARQRQAIIVSHPELRERELIKMATLAASATAALTARGVGQPDASLAAEAGIAVFRVGFARWVGAADGTPGLAAVMDELFGSLSTLTAPPVADHPELVQDLDRPGAWVLIVDGVIQSHVDLDDPAHLELEYVRWLGHLVDLAAPPGTPLRAVHLGGGGLTLARYIARTRPGSAQLAAEASAEIAELVTTRLPLDQPPRKHGPAGRIRVRVADARTVLETQPAAAADVVIADVFAGAQTPAHLTSVEFTQAAARALAPDGLYAVNVGDGPPLAHVRARLATVRSVFPHTCLIAEPGVLRGRRFGNLVIAAARHPLPLADLTRRTASGPFPARVMDGPALHRFTAAATPITDTTAQPSPTSPEAFT